MSVAKRNSPPGLKMRASRLRLLVLDETAFPMPPLRPWVRIEQVDARERTRGQPVEQFTGVAEMQTDIAELVFVDGGKRLGDGVDEGSLPMKPLCGLVLA